MLMITEYRLRKILERHLEGIHDDEEVVEERIAEILETVSEEAEYAQSEE